MLLQHIKIKTRQKCVIYEDKPKTRQERVIQLHIQYKKHVCSEKVNCRSKISFYTKISEKNFKF